MNPLKVANLAILATKNNLKSNRHISCSCLDNILPSFSAEVPTATILEDQGTSLKVIPVGRSVTLTCVTSGIPEPVVQWNKINGKLPNGIIVEGGKLKILSVKVEDAGTFRCSSLNLVGHVHADMRLFVQGTEIFFIFSPCTSLFFGYSVFFLN